MATRIRRAGVAVALALLMATGFFATPHPHTLWPPIPETG